MQYTMQIFEYEDHDQFRVIDHNGEPWFVLAEVCKKLGIVNTGDAASSLDEDERMTIGITDSQKYAWRRTPDDHHQRVWPLLSGLKVQEA